MAIVLLCIGAFLLILVERYVYSRFWKRGLSIDISFKDRYAFEGEENVLTEILENRSYLPLPFVHAKFQLRSGLQFDSADNMNTSDQDYKNDIFSILFYQRVTRRLPFTCKKRGFYTINTADLVSADLFYNLHMVTTLRQNAIFYVYPRAVDVSRFTTPLKKLMGDVTQQSFLFPDPFEFKGLRDYTLSDPMNTINWKATARAGSMMVNLYDSTTTKRVVILLNVEDETVIRHNDLHEEAIRLASTLAAWLLAEGCPVRIVTNGRDVETRERIMPINAGGPGEIEEIYRAMARMSMTDMPEEFYPLVEKEMERPDHENAGYILISSSMKQNLQDAYFSLSRASSGMWITPLYDNMEFHVGDSESTTVYRWEVEGHA